MSCAKTFLPFKRSKTVDDIDNVAAREEREAERFSAFLREMRSKPLPLVTKCIECGQVLEEARRPYARCFPCAARAERRRM